MDPEETRLKEARERWRLRPAVRIADTATSEVYRTSGPGGEMLALKLLKPYGADEINGVALLAWYDGDGAVRIIDQTETAILMEWLEGDSAARLVHDGEDDRATAALCDVLARMHAPRARRLPALEPLSARCAPLREIDLSQWPRASRSLIERAGDLAWHLLESAGASVPLHGDFHHDNVIGAPRGWLAIDAKGVLGDPAYEVANVFRNPLGAEDLAREPDRIAALAHQFSRVLGAPRERILGWAAAHCALSMCWSRAAGQPIESDLDLLPPLLAALDSELAA